MSHKTPEPVDIPEAASHVWEWFWKLSAQRSSGFGGAEPISWLEMDAWARLTNTLVTPEEFDMLSALDLAYRSACSEESASKREQKKTNWPA